MYNETITLDDSIIELYRNYIEAEYIPTLEDGNNMLALWDEIKNVTKEDPNYKNYIYEYYVKAYFGLAIVPTNQYYYQLEYARYDSEYNFVYEDFLIITDSWCMASFETDKNVRVTYDGYFDSLKDGFTVATPVLSNDEIKENVNTLVLSSYTSVNSYRTILIAMQVFRYFPTVLITMAILALLVFCFCKILCIFKSPSMHTFS